ncbi:SMI1/KNR4 family protein [Xanthocytophaga flava]|uniref:SMI1/KNR4 family protein n=1 Tax=Xanthocytophaga flava TaxID=3048013 RepID=UPI0028D0F497|nr:SMI1/KNR4 family protein [Xanthocytophaga flavus]MDJ1470983.1 SMI1/KNR4 family protein [Xanthocytophaga flavus]
MKQLTIAPRITKSEIRLLEEELETVFPEYYFEFMKLYSGLGVLENRFQSDNEKIYEISSFCKMRVIYDYSKLFKEQGWGIKIPFAMDNGGWLYCISLDEEDKGIIYLHNVDWTDKQDAFEKVANSFEEFINGLQSEEDV